MDIQEEELINPTNLQNILKGIRFTLGYTQKDLAKEMGVGQGTIYRWESKLVTPLRQKTKIIGFFNKNNFNRNELLKYGKINIKDLVEEIKLKLNVSYRQCSEILDICPATLMRILKEEITLTPKTIKKIIEKYNEIKNSNDKRDLIFQMYKKRLSNRKDNYIKNKENLLQIKLAEKYPEVVGFKIENNQGKSFEEYVYDIFKNNGFVTFRNPIVQDKSLKIQYCIDLYAIRKKTKIIIECKNINKTQIRHTLGKIITRLAEIKYINSNIILVINNDIKKSKKILALKKGITILDKGDLEYIKQNPQLLSKLFNNKIKNKSVNKIKSIEDIKLVKENHNLSLIQLALLNRYNPAYINEIINKKKRLSKNVIRRMNKILRGMLPKSSRELHFMANKIRFFNYLKNRTKENINLWKRAENYKKIINFYLINHSGRDLEKKISNIMLKAGYTIFENVILSNQKVSEKYEIDIYAIKNNEEIIIEAKKRIPPHNISAIIRELKHKAKELNINKIILVTKEKILDRANKISNNNIKLINESNLEQYFLENHTS